MNPHEEKPDLTKESAPHPESAESLAGLLHANRLRKGLSLQDVADLTKYSKWQLEALETKNWGVLPQGFVLRALVRKYAEALHIDPDLAIEMLAKETGNKAQSGKSENLVSSLDYKMSPTPTDKVRSGGFSLSSIFWLLILMIIVVLGVAIWQGAISLEDLNLGFVKDWFNAV